MSILCAAQAGTARGLIGEHPIHEHPRAPCALNRQESLMGPYESTPSTSIHEHPAHCTDRNRSWVYGRAPCPRASMGILCAAQVGMAHVSMGGAPHPRAPTSSPRAALVGTAHGPMGEHTIHGHPRAPCAMHRQEPLEGPWESTPSTSIREHLVMCTGRNRLLAPWESAPSTSIHEHPVR